MLNRVQKYMISGVFMILISFPLANQYFSFFKKRELDNPVEIVKAPVFDIKRLDKYPNQFEEYFLDCLKLRDKLVLVNSLVRIFLFNTSPMSDKVIIGKNGWLFEADKLLNAYTNSNPLRTGQLDSIRNTLLERNAMARKKGIKFYVVFIPNKAEIYPEYLPETILKSSDMNRTDQILQYMKSDTGMVFIDLRKALLDNKNGIRLYFQTDNHWNYLGAYYAYCEVMRRIKKDFPSVGDPISLDSLKIDSSKHQAGGESTLINMEEWISENRIELIPLYKEKAENGESKEYICPQGFPYEWDYENDLEIKNDSLPKAVFIRDSYLDFNKMFFQEHFRRSVFIFDSWFYGRNYGIIEKENPDIVVLCLLDSGYDSILEHANDKDDNE
jgi:alginate O-acetyltransferase complex protein AlgJ